MSDAPSQSDEDAPPEGPRGFFSRIFDALSPAEDEAPAPRAAPAPGLGNLRLMRAEDVAVPKSDIVSVPVSVSFDGLVDAFRESGRTRIPVHEGSLDQPLGLVNLKDFALRHGFARAEGAGTEAFDLRGMLRPLLYVPPSMPLAALLQRMQAERIHMALVIDEYGGTDGLCTIEDLLETVVGEIDDEHDREEPESFAREAEGVWVADGATDLVEFEREIGLDLTAHEDIEPEEADTLGGLVFLLSGHVPQAGEVVVHPDGPVFEVLDADARRVKRLRVRVPAASAASGAAGVRVRG
jgi:magnesium and cobalt transporter